MTADRFDLVVLGSGPAGEKGAATAAYHGRKVAVVERAPNVGGTVVTSGGIPTKALRETALRLSGAARSDGLTVDLDREALFQRLRARAGAASAVMAETVAANLDRQGIAVVHGVGRLVPGGVAVVTGQGERVLRAGVVLVATGSRPARPAFVPFDGRNVLDPNEILTLDRSFASIVIVGAGAVGCEYASILAAIGIRVWLVDVSEHLLPFLDGELSRALAASMDAAGVQLRLGRGVGRIVGDGEALQVVVAGGEVLRPERVLWAAGRVANVEGLGLEETGVALDATGHVVVDAHYASTVPGVFAAGDVVGPPGLASASMEQGRVAVCHAFGFPLRQAVDDLQPLGIYTIPEVASVGLTEEAAAGAGIDFEIGRAWFDRNTRAVVAGDAEGFVKLVFERDGGRLLGVHILGTEAAELVHLGQAALRHGAGIDEFVHATFNVPTRSDAYKYAAYDGLKRAEARAAFGDVAGA